MCVAIPGKVIEVNDGKARIDFSGNEVMAYSGLVDIKPGDYALVHAGCIIQKLRKAEADELSEMMELIESEPVASKGPQG